VPGAAAWTRRSAIGAMSAAGLGFALFGPRGSKEATGGKLVLDYWEKWTGKIEGQSMMNVVKAFNDSQPRIFVRYFSIGGIDEKAQIAIAGGAPPDILGLWNYNIPGFADTGAILPLDDLAAPHHITPDIYAQGMRPVVRYKGKMWATINTGGTLALYYNKQHFREAGLDPEQPPRTIPELDAANRKLMIDSPSGRITRMGFHHREPGWWPFIWPFYFGAKLVDTGAPSASADQIHRRDAERRREDKRPESDPFNPLSSPLCVSLRLCGESSPPSAKALIDTQEVIAAYEWVQTYPKAFGLSKLNDLRSTFGNYDSPLNPFISGQLSMEIQGPWLANMINLYNKDLDYAVAPFPVAEGLYDAAAPLGLVDTDILVIPRGVKNPEASMEFIAYTQRQEIVEYLSTIHCKGSPLATSSESFLQNHPNKGVRVFDAIAKSPRAFIVPQTRAWLQIRDNFVTAFDEVWNGANPTAVMNQVQQRAQSALDRVADQAARRAAKEHA
jgi:multiple sugar transport system substrate-binding protein